MAYREMSGDNEGRDGTSQVRSASNRVGKGHPLVRQRRQWAMQGSSPSSETVAEVEPPLITFAVRGCDTTGSVLYQRVSQPRAGQ